MTRFRLLASTLVIATLSIANGCLFDLDAYGLRVEIEATNEPLASHEVEKLREITRGIASHYGLQGPVDFDEERPGMFELYITPEGPAINIGLYVAKDRREAHIQVDDWQSAGDVSERTRAGIHRVMVELEQELPGRSVRVETRNLGFWRP